jgi:hypothetical protein
MGFPQSRSLSVGRRLVWPVGRPGTGLGRALGGVGSDRLDSGVKAGFNSTESNPSLPSSPLTAASETEVVPMLIDPFVAARPSGGAAPGGGAPAGRRPTGAGKPGLRPGAMRTREPDLGTSPTTKSPTWGRRSGLGAWHEDDYQD